MTENVTHLVKNEVDAHIGGSVRLHRLRLNLKASEMAEALGIDATAYGRKESGFDRFNGMELMTVCQTLDVTPAMLMGDMIGEGTKHDRRLADQEPFLYLEELINTMPPAELVALAFFCRRMYD